MKNINPTKTKSWNLLKKHFNNMKKVNIKDLFEKDKNRFSSFSICFDDIILIDYSKNIITKETIKKLIQLAKECDLNNAILSMFCGKKINYTENRAVLHTALRNHKNISIEIDGINIIPKIKKVLNKMKNFCSDLIDGNWKGFTGERITHIVNIGIGGSDLGPYMVTEALKFYKNHLNVYFVSNIDGTHITEILKYLSPKNTLFLIASKTFTTQETITNAYSAKDWFLKYAKDKKYLSRHFIALSSNIDEVKKFGINTENIFELWNWVGGRYSLWSCMGLSIALSIGFNNFEKLLRGAYAMDQHFLKQPFEKNIPIILGLISIWYNNFFNFETESILVYDQYMHLFSSYFQQVNMESNGKSIDRNGNLVNYQTGSILWGGYGTNSQHAFYQLMHQGTKIVPCDFIVPIISHNPVSDHHQKLLANFFAQTKALAFGKKSENNHIKLYKYDSNKIKILPFKILPGNRPTNSILIKEINPYNLGSLIAMYEHKIFTQGVVLNINSFDQWGVELGKQLSKKLFSILRKEKILNTSSYDSSTNGLINFYKLWKK
ncbi:pgi [Wigglesworthia glossinidia endosymbiont of Glossina brevipalpis]|uniref:Glucose-6-phosphate isomerase n=1 Tax=Wigglesworthia glossinidia brevipalpis TaxID=36870 RepID=G6PI_WIGBR|nr:RecName: Full=Glucose-6-phosphate isomerase; Short=GPI; AltName: Full=Phosphoglucose isomerase; Short=PGI; AltName: Full=Phosphohexose isomerase; Short=PHI [Wigglesworthia glossinidia endosymbiont of Glossina brevipalpis]BAC24744.1 pgi [Wigglesworthia glossinidia endosymbiont of Glossina brevipalpis]